MGVRGLFAAVAMRLTTARVALRVVYPEWQRTSAGNDQCEKSNCFTPREHEFESGRCRG